VLLAGALVLGTLVFAAAPGGHGARSAASFLAGAGLAGALLFGGIAAVALFAGEAGGLSLVVALTTYATTVGVFAAVLAVADPDVLDPAAFAVGLLVLGAAAVTWQWGRYRAALAEASRPRPAPRRPESPQPRDGGPHGSGAT
jgi:hypothetical protein